MGQQDHLERQTVEVQLLMAALIRAVSPLPGRVECFA